MNTAIWGYDGIFPGPTIEARVGRRASLRLRNGLSVPIVNHLHGGRTAPESDGYPTDFILPAGGFPQSHMHDPRARITEDEREYLYSNNQRAATLWYHDHRMDFTGPQIWRGLAGFYILRDAEEERLPLPRGDKEIALLICDRSFEADGSLRYPALDASLRDTPGVSAQYMGGVLGDVILVNGAPWPRLEVANVRYRFRILNASNARRYELGLDPSPRGAAPFVQIRHRNRFFKISAGIESRAGQSCWRRAGRGWKYRPDHAIRRSPQRARREQRSGKAGRSFVRETGGGSGHSRFRFQLPAREP
jgi:spore coat protein A